MKFCKCGGSMKRVDKTKIKSTGETKIRLRCDTCKVFESHYFDQEPEFRLRRSTFGRPSYVEQR